MADNEKLQLGLSLQVDLDAFEAEWRDKQAKIQSIINGHTFDVKIGGIQGLTEVQKEMEKFSRGVRSSTKVDLVNTDSIKGVKDEIRAIERVWASLSRQQKFSNEATMELTPHAAQLAMRYRELREQLLTYGLTLKEAEKASKKFQSGTAQAASNLKLLGQSTQSVSNAQKRNITTINAQTDAYRRQSGVLNGLKQFMNSYISLLGGYRLLSNIKQITSEFELQRVSLRAITQDAAFADALFTKIKTTATESPFSTKDLVTYTKQLAAYRIENEQLYGTMNMLADVSAGLGVSMDRLILAYGQVKAASVLRGTELRQFTEAGIPLVDELAKKFSQLRGEVVSTGEVFDLISTRQVPFEMVADIFKEMIAEGGRFYEMQKKQSESLYGVFENLKDNIQNAYDEIGQSNRGLLMGIGKLATAVAKNLNTITDAMNPILATWGAYRLALKLSAAESSRLAASNALLLKAERALAASRAATNVQTGLAYKLMIQAKIANDRYAIATIRAATANSVFARSFYKIQAALIANPLIAVLTGTAAVLVGSITLWNKYKESLSSSAKSNERVAKSVEEIQKPLQDANKSYERIIKKIKEYDVLLNTQEKSLSELKRIYPELFSQYKTDEERQKAVAEATKKRVAAVNELKSLSPELLSAIDSESASVQALADAWGDVTQAMRDNEVEALKVKKANTEALIATAQRNLQTWREKRDSAGDTDQQRIWNAMMAAEEKKIEGLEKDLAGYNRELEALKKATDDAAAAQLLWRKEYNKFMKGDTLKDHELAALNFADTIKETRDAWKDATDRAKEYQDAIDAAKTQQQTAEVRKNVEEYKKRLATQQQIIKNAESYAKFAGFSLQTGGKADTTPLDNLKAELSLVEKIYRRYGELRRLMSDEAAKADIEEIYGNLTDVDFLDPAKLKARLQKMLKAAQDMGDSGKQLAIELGLKIQDIDLNEAKDKLEAALSSLSQQIKQQQDASEFFEKMLGLTGDVELSTNLTLGVTGVDVEGGNVGQLLSQQLAEILYSEPVRTQVATEFDLTGDWNADELEEAIRKGEVSVEMLQNLADKLPQDVQPKFREALASFVDFNKQQVESLFKTIDKYGDYETQMKLLATQMSTEMATVMKMPAPEGIDEAEWAAYIASAIAAIQKKYEESVAKLDFSDFQKRFASELSNLDAVTVGVVESMMGELQKIMDAGNLDATSLKSIMDLMDKLRGVKIEKQPIKEFSKAWEDLIDAIKKGDKAGKASALSNLGASLSVMQQSAQNTERAISEIIDTAMGLAEALGVTFSDDTEAAIKAFKDGVGITTSVLSAMIAVVIALETAMTPLLVIALALGAAFAAISWISGAKVRKANKEIERQEKLLKSLERAYNRLEEVQEELVGTDWVRNQQQQIANLQKQIAAFEAQRRAEQSKGKKTDEEAIDDYTDKILDAQEQMRELRKEIVSEMAGTDLGSAAKDFAQSWLDAYLSFDDTMGALKASFKDMMKTMVQNSMMAKLVQKRLEPVFDAIDKAYEDAELTPAEWQSIMDMGNKAIEYIDEDLNHLAEMLNLRDQLGDATQSELTGIAKGVAQASEETVLTLAGYANSILYYQIWLKNDVAAIRAILEGKVAAVSAAPTGDGGFNVGQLVSLQQQSLSQLQAINANTGNTVSQLQTLNDKIDSIISTAGTSSRKVVNTRLSN